MSVASTLHGYQVQYLYTLYRMLRSPESKEVFLPEGREDLDIYLDGQIVETVQVKCYSGTILYSDLFSKAKSTSLFSRGKASLEENPNVKISFVAVGYGNSKGGISNKLLKLSSLTKFLNKEEVLHLDYSSSKELASKINWLAQSETELNDVVEAALKERFPSIDPFIAKDYLLQWVHYLVINEVKCLTFLDYFSAGKQFENGDGDIMHRINIHHIDLLRKAFPNVDVYHSEIIKDDIFEDIDLTFEKHISREKLPLAEMQEPRTMMVHLYEKSYVLPSRKAYCDQLITLRKLFVDVIKEYWQGIDDIHRVGKAYNAKMDQVSYDVCDKISNTHIELPATEINRFGLGYEINKKENEDQSAKDNLKKLNSLYSHYSTDLTIFFRQCYQPSGGFINDVQRMTMILLDAQDKLKKLQSLFHQVFDGYVDVVEIKQLDEREKQQMTCLIAVYNWLAQNQPYMSCRQLLKQIKPKKLTATQRFEVNDEVVDNPSQALVDTIEDLEKLRNMQLRDIYNRCSHLDDLSIQIVDKYIKRYDDTIEGRRNCVL